MPLTDEKKQKQNESHSVIEMGMTIGGQRVHVLDEILREHKVLGSLNETSLGAHGD